MTNYSTYYLRNVRLILLTKYNYKRLYDIESISRIDLNLPVSNSKYMVNTLSALSLISHKGKISYRAPSVNKATFSKSSSKNEFSTTSSIFGLQFLTLSKI